MSLPKPYYEHAGITIYHCDCREILEHLPKVDLVLTDPPYEAEAHAPMRRTKATVEQRSEKDELPFPALTEELRSEVCQWALGNCMGWALMFCQAEAVSKYQLQFGQAYKRPMVWVKPDSSPQFTGDRPAMGYETIIASYCGDDRIWWNGGGRRGVFTFPCGQNNQHPTQKPLALIQELVTLFSHAAQTILDPFMGSGTTLVAAKQLGRKAIGIELEERYCRIAVERLSQDLLPFGDDQ